MNEKNVTVKEIKYCTYTILYCVCEITVPLRSVIKVPVSLRQFTVPTVQVPRNTVVRTLGWLVCSVSYASSPSSIMPAFL